MTWYARLWRRSVWKLHLVLIPLVFVILLLEAVTLLGASGVGWAVGGTLLLWAAMPLTPWLLYRKGERVLKVGADGVSVERNGRSRLFGWKHFSRIEDGGEQLFLMGRRGNAFIIAKRAFESSGDSEGFVRRVEEMIGASGR